MVVDLNGCWLWPRYVDRFGYGRAQVDGKKWGGRHGKKWGGRHCRACNRAAQARKRATAA